MRGALATPAPACCLLIPASGQPPYPTFCPFFPPLQYAAKDAQRKAAIEAKNEADSLIYSGGCLMHCNCAYGE